VVREIRALAEIPASEAVAAVVGAVRALLRDIIRLSIKGSPEALRIPVVGAEAQGVQVALLCTTRPAIRVIRVAVAAPVVVEIRDLPETPVQLLTLFLSLFPAAREAMAALAAAEVAELVAAAAAAEALKMFAELPDMAALAALMARALIHVLVRRVHAALLVELAPIAPAAPVSAAAEVAAEKAALAAVDT